MKQQKRKNRRAFRRLALGIGALAAVLWSLCPAPDGKASEKGLDTEWGYEIDELKAKGVMAPRYLQAYGSRLLVTDTTGGVFSITTEGKVSVVAGRAKIKRPAGVAVAPRGFGSYAGRVFVLAASHRGRGACEVERIDKSGTVTLFAKLPKAGSLGAGRPGQCGDLEFGAAKSPFANKLYAVTNANAAIYEIDSAANARVFGLYDKPVAFELTAISFAPPDDPKAPKAMLVGTRPRMEKVAKLGRIGVIAPDGKLRDEPYLVGFVRPTGFGFSPAGFGTYSHVFFIADAGRWAEHNSAHRDGRIYRVDKGIAHSYATGLVDPACPKFVGDRMLLCDPAIRGKKAARGAIVAISSML